MHLYIDRYVFVILWAILKTKGMQQVMIATSELVSGKKYCGEFYVQHTSMNNSWQTSTAAYSTIHYVVPMKRRILARYMSLLNQLPLDTTIRPYVNELRRPNKEQCDFM
jgi:hypothetical protein